MRNKLQLFTAFGLAAMMSTALSADTGAMGGAAKGTCIFIEGLGMRIPVFVMELLAALFNC